MGRKSPEQTPGYGKLLDAWTPSEDADEPIGCIATSFTFSASFFEEECLSRFLNLDSDPDQDGPVYLIEREEKLAALACAAALVDQHHCRGTRSLRWDLLPVRIQPGIQHSKICLLVWSGLVRVIIGSANLTEDGYRRNQEIFGVLDFHPGGQFPLRCLDSTVEFLGRLLEQTHISEGNVTPAAGRCQLLLERATELSRSWGKIGDKDRHDALRFHTVFCRPRAPSLFQSLRSIWPAGSPPFKASVVSPFFDTADESNWPATELWKLLRQRGRAECHFHVTAEDAGNEGGLLVHAPQSLLQSQPKGRADVLTEMHRVEIEDHRPLHAKAIWVEDDRFDLYCVGSSNFTVAGTGLSQACNWEANLCYLADDQRDPDSHKGLYAAFPDSEPLEVTDDTKWMPSDEECEDEACTEPILPQSFGEAIFDGSPPTVRLTFISDPPADWRVLNETSPDVVLDESQWEASGRQSEYCIAWNSSRPPSGFFVESSESAGAAWWPVNVLSPQSLPAPEELKQLPLDVLIDVLGSSRPLHRVLGEYLRRQEQKKRAGLLAPIVDPHKKVDTSQFLLQRTRRFSFALRALRERLERPAATIESLRWRLTGPLGVTALADALLREGKSSEEKVFLLAELILELSRVRPQESPTAIPCETHMAEIRLTNKLLKDRLQDQLSSGPENLRRYVTEVMTVTV